MANPLISVITPTWQRHDLLISRCMLSVAAQDYPDLEHVIVSDGPDQLLKDKLAGIPGVVYGELAEKSRTRWGVAARLRALELAAGELVCYLDDDNAFRPQHLTRIAEAMERNPAAGFGYTQIMMHRPDHAYVVGASPPMCGSIDTSAMFHRRDVLEHATWRDDGQSTIDWDLAERWKQAGIFWVFVPEVTADYYFAGA
jgi:glycosyltransferase involved in cell wall biosynthesis